MRVGRIFINMRLIRWSGLIRLGLPNVAAETWSIAKKFLAMLVFRLEVIEICRRLLEG